MSFVRTNPGIGEEIFGIVDPIYPSQGVFTESSVKEADWSYVAIMSFPELELGRRAGTCEAKLDSSKVLQ